MKKIINTILNVVISLNYDERGGLIFAILLGCCLITIPISIILELGLCKGIGISVLISIVFWILFLVSWVIRLIYFKLKGDL